MRNYLGRGLCCLPKPEADNTNRGLNNSSYPARTEFNNCFIIFQLFSIVRLQGQLIYDEMTHNRVYLF